MTYELTFYLFLTFVGLLLCLKEFKSEKTYLGITFLLFTIYSIIVRYSGFEMDMKVYAISLEFFSFDLYYLREPIYWIISRYIYKALNSPELTFITYDLVSFIFLLKARKNFQLPQYFTYLLILFFPSVLGLNNIYRQYLAYSVFLYFLSLNFSTGSGFLKKWFFLFTSILTHNVSALFTPLSFLINRNKLNYKAFATSLMVFTLLPFLLDTKSSMDTGEVNPYLYMVVLLFLFLFYLASHKFKLKNIQKSMFYIFIYCISLTFLSIILMESAQSKRIGMFSLIICLIPLVKAVEFNFRQKNFIRILLFISLILPTFLFSSSFNMLLTASMP